MHRCASICHVTVTWGMETESLSVELTNKLFVWWGWKTFLTKLACFFFFFYVMNIGASFIIVAILLCWLTWFNFCVVCMIIPAITRLCPVILDTYYSCCMLTGHSHLPLPRATAGLTLTTLVSTQSARRNLRSNSLGRRAHTCCSTGECPLPPVSFLPLFFVRKLHSRVIVSAVVNSLDASCGMM